MLDFWVASRAERDEVPQFVRISRVIELFDGDDVVDVRVRFEAVATDATPLTPIFVTL